MLLLRLRRLLRLLQLLLLRLLLAWGGLGFCEARKDHLGYLCMQRSQGCCIKLVASFLGALAPPL